MKMKNLFKTAVFAGALVAGITAASSLSVWASDDWDTKYPNAEKDDLYTLCTAKHHNYEYGNENFLKMVKKGDIYFDATGSGGIAGHIAIVEGVYYNSTYDEAYIRLIEAPGSRDSVRRNVLDIPRFINSKDNRILRVNNVTDEQIDAAVNFCKRQIGAPYPNILGALSVPARNYDPDDTTQPWYCSELIYAAYYTATDGAVDLNPDNNFCWPKEIRDSQYVQAINTHFWYYGIHDYDDPFYRTCRDAEHEGYFDGYYLGYTYCELETLSDGRVICTECGHIWYNPTC